MQVADANLLVTSDQHLYAWSGSNTIQNIDVGTTTWQVSTSRTVRRGPRTVLTSSGPITR